MSCPRRSKKTSPPLVLVIGVLACAVAGGAACGRTKIAETLDSSIAVDTATATDAIVDADDGGDARFLRPVVDAAADAVTDGDELACFRLSYMRPGLVCFGDDPTPYLMYLAPRDGGPAVGVCPGPTDFDLHLSEGDPGFFPCGGPLTSDQIAAAHDAGAPMTDADSVNCCYWVEERWGF